MKNFHLLETALRSVTGLSLRYFSQMKTSRSVQIEAKILPSKAGKSPVAEKTLFSPTSSAEVFLLFHNLKGNPPF